MKGYEGHLSEAITQGKLYENDGVIIRGFMHEYSALVSPGSATIRNKYFLLFSLAGIFKDNNVTLDTTQVSEYLKIVSAIQQSEYSDNYRRMLISLLKRFALFMDITDPKIQSIKLPKVQWKTKKPEDMLTKAEVMQVIQAAGNSRDRCLISMVYDGSNRIIELLRLNWNDLTHDSMGYYIETDAKTGHKRKIRFTSSIPHIEQWQKDYPGKAEGDNPVFITLHDPRNRLTKSAYDNRIYQIAKGTGISKLKPGIMRSTRITHDVAAGQDVQYIMLKNWGNLKTSMLDRYTNLSGDYIDSKALEYAGLKKVDKVQQADPMAPVQCPKCHTVNEPGNKHCRECGKALTKDGEDELSMVRDGMTPEEWISFWTWKKDHP